MLPSSDLNPSELVESGKREFYNQNFKCAVDSLTRAIELNSSLSEAFYFRALAKQQLYQLGHEQRQYDGLVEMQSNAFDDVSECIRLNPAYAVAYLLRSELFLGFNFQFDKAIDDLRMALHLVPDSVPTLLKLASIYFHPFAQNLPEALTLVSQAISLDPSNEAAVRMRLQLHKNFGKIRESIEDFDLLIAKDPNNATNYCDRAELRDQLHDCDGAFADLDRACEISEEWQMYRGEFHMLHRQFDLAEKDLLHMAATMEGISRHFPHMRLTALYVGLEKFDKALEQINTLIELGPASMTTPYFSTRSYINLKLGESEKALADCNHVLSLIEEDGSRSMFGIENNLSYKKDKALALVKRGTVYSHKQAHTLAQDDFDAAYELFSSPKDYEGIGKLAEAYISTGSYQSAVRLLSEIIGINAESAKAYFQRGTAFMKLEMIDNAISDFSECMRLNPNHDDVLQARAALYEMRGQNDLAKVDRQRSLDSSVNHYLPEEFDYWMLFFGTSNQGT